MLKFGAITIDTSHPMAFAEYLANGDRARYTAIYNDGFRGDDEVEAFAKHHGLTICKTVDELADLVDIGMVHSCNWDKHMSYIDAFAKRGKPVFIDKPLVGNLADCKKLQALVDSGVKVLGTSALRYCYEVDRVRSKLAETDNKILHINLTVGVDEFNYAIHAYEFVCALLDDHPVSCRYIGTSTSDKFPCDIYFLRFKGGATAVISGVLGRYAGFHTSILAGNGAGDTCFSVDTSKLYEAMLNEVFNELEGKENKLAPMAELLIPIKAALACKASKLAGGKEMTLADEDIAGVCFDGYAFEATYGANSPKSYLDL